MDIRQAEQTFAVPSATDTSTPGSSGDPFAPSTSNVTKVTSGGTATTPPSTGTQPANASATTAVAASTTAAPPTRPTDADVALLDFVQSVELTIRDLYDVAIRAKVFEGMTNSDITAIREAHEGYGSAIAGLIGRKAANRSNGVLFGQLQAGFAGSASTVAAAAADLENVAVATHIDVIGRLVGVDGSTLLASIAIGEARNATVLRMFAGVTGLAEQLADTGKAIQQSDYLAK